MNRHGKTGRLKRLIREKKFLERQEIIDRMTIEQSLKVERVQPEAPAKARAEKPGVKSPLSLDPGIKPKSLDGLSAGAIEILAVDGQLTPEEREWLRTKKFASPYWMLR